MSTIRKLIKYLEEQKTDMEEFDVREYMDEGDHILAAVGIRQGKLKENKKIDNFIKMLKKYQKENARKYF